MSAGARIGAFGALLAVVFAAAALAGSEIDPDTGDAAETGDDHRGKEGMAMESDDHSSDAHAGGTATAAAAPGLAVAEGGYRLVLDRTDVPAAQRASLDFRIETDAGRPVTGFEEEHERRMHLIVVRRDLEGFQHLHPVMAEDGTWHAEADTSLPGAYRVFADFALPGESMTLGADLFAAGAFDPAPPAEPAATAATGDGYDVTIEAGDPRAGEASPVEFTVARGGEPIDGVQPYLGADGHLVTIREGDLAFLHTHPEGEPGGPGPISFGVEYPTPGRYRLFLQFKHAGRVHTAEFTQVVEP